MITINRNLRIEQDDLDYISDKIQASHEEYNREMLGLVKQLETDVGLLKNTLEGHISHQEERTKMRNSQMNEVKDEIKQIWEEVKELNKKTDKNASFINKGIGIVTVVSMIGGVVITNVWQWLSDKLTGA